MKSFVLCLLSLTLTLASTNAASAQFRSNYGCGNVRAVQVHHAPVYHAPALKAFAPYALPVAITPDYYFSTNSYYRDSLLADAIAWRLTQGQQGQQLQQPATPLPQRLPATLLPQQQPQAAPQPVPPASVPQAQGAEPTATFNPNLFGAIVERSCIQCHSGTAKRGGFDLSGWAAMSAAERYFVLDKVGAQEMPPREDVAKGKAHPVDDAGFAQFRAWAKAAGRPGK